jgi:predicted glycosyltransferase/peptidoglycan/xylan/chitin deacetylase (PgdA/CDA1 family)
MYQPGLYYRLKRFLPWTARMAVRRRFARWVRPQTVAVWPVLPGSARLPRGWPGWPEAKQFALVLTHDVEGRLGLSKCQRLMELEQRLGFRSCFNFVPEGGYRVPDELRAQLVQDGFEVGIHDLSHDGSLYRSERTFREKAARINRYVRDWGAAGFRSAFMLHRLPWLHALDIRYDASTFDTDPFEPQPDGAATVFPFWVPQPRSALGQEQEQERERKPELRSRDAPSEAPPAKGDGQRRFAGAGPRAGGYVELPYTLPQDSTLFLLLQEAGPDIWLRKLDWVAEHGGMALVTIHPDYVQFEGDPRRRGTYPAAYYVKLLEYVRQRYAGRFWPALPVEIARWVASFRPAPAPPAAPAWPCHVRTMDGLPRIWIDLDNTPHVPFFQPIIAELEARGYPVLLTARDAFQVYELARVHGLGCVRIGRHHGRNRVRKALGLVWRAIQLAPAALRESPAFAVSHGSRSQILICNALRIPTLLLEDYEFSQFPVLMRPSWILAPEVIPDAALACDRAHVRKYPGLKEDVYAWQLRPDSSILPDLGLSESDVVVLVRPPATEAHYHNPESERLFARLMERACRTPGVRVILLPRNQAQEMLLRAQAPHWFAEGRTIVPDRALDGLNLIWHSDLVVSGGGTMNREAAALGVPVYSIFRGRIGAVDRQLVKENRLVLVESEAAIDTLVRFGKREVRPHAQATSRRTLEAIVRTIEEIAADSQRRARKQD